MSSSHFAQHVYYRILPPLIPVLAVVLDYPLWQLGLLISFYSFGMGVAQAPFGVISDRIDRQFLLPTGLGLAGVAYVVFALAPLLGGPLPAITISGYVFESGFLVMSIAMGLVGIGLAVVHPTGYPMITDNVRDGNKGKALGMFGASSKLGDATAPAVIAVLILALAWERIILVFGIAGIVYGIALFVVLRDGDYETIPTGQRREDEERRASSGHAADRRSYVYPMVTVYFFFISSMLSTRGLNSFLPAFLVAVYAYSFEAFGVTLGTESIANLYFSGMLVAGAVMQLYLGRLTDIYDSRRILLVCMFLAVIGLVSLAVVDLHPLALFVVIVVLGTGLYGVNPARDALVSDLSPPDHEGRTFGYIFTAVTLTGTPLPTVIGYVLELVGMREGFLLIAIGPVLAMVCIALLYSPRVYREPTVDVELSD